MGAYANGCPGAPIKAQDEAKTSGLGEDGNTEWRPRAPVPFGCCRKRRSRRCKVSPGALPAFAFAPCARRFRQRNAFVSITLTGPSCTLLSVVGVRGFEPPTSCSQSKRATRLRYTPKTADYATLAVTPANRDRAPTASSRTQCTRLYLAE